MGMEWVYLDVKMTQDGVAVLFHDDTLERTTGTGAAMAATPFAAVDTCSLFGRYIASTWASAKPKSDAPPNFDAPLRVADVFTKKPRAASW